MNEAIQMRDVEHSQMVPKCYQGKPQDTLNAMMMGMNWRLKPYPGARTSP